MCDLYILTNGELYIHYRKETKEYYLSDTKIGACVWNYENSVNFLKHYDISGFYGVKLEDVEMRDKCGVCGKLTKLKCSKCDKHYFCSMKHRGHVCFV